MIRFAYDVSTGTEQRKNFLLRIPLIFPAAALGAGIFLADSASDISFIFWLVVAIISSAAVMIASLKKRWTVFGAIMVSIVFLALGGLRFDQSYRSVAKDDIVLFTGTSPIFATVQGHVTSYPVVSYPENNFGFKPQPAVKFLFSVYAVKTPAGFVPASGLCRVTIREPYNLPAPGAKLELVGSMGRYRRPANPGQGDVLRTARITGTNVWFTVPTHRGAKAIESVNQSKGWRNTLWRVRAFLRQRLTESDDILSGQLVSALILGERQPGLRDLSRTMMRAGIAHFLSISGLHLGIFLAFVYFLCRLLMLGPRKSAVAVLVVLAAYLILAEARAPMLRSAIMAACIAGGMAVGRRFSSLNSLALAWMILLLFDPGQLFLPGFQLSFAIVAGLIIFNSKVQWLLFGWWYRRRGLMVFRQNQRIKRWYYFRFGEVMIEFISMSFCAYFIATPLAVYHFGFFSPYAVFLGFLLFPLVVGVLIPGYIAMATAWPMPNLAGFFGGISTWFASLIVDIVGFAQKLPGLWLSVYPVNGWWVVFYFITFIAVLYSPRSRNRKYIAAGLVAIFIAITVLTQIPQKPGGQAELNLLSIGWGQCAVLRTPDGRNWLIDAGSVNPGLRADNTLLPFFRACKLRDPVGAVISHGHPDHFSILPMTVEKMGLDESFSLYSSEYLFDGHAGNQTGRMLERLASCDVPFHKLTAGDTLQLGRDTVAEVLWPAKNLFKTRPKISENDLSLVLRVTCGGRSILIPGDVGAYAQKRLLEHPEKLKSDVIILPHHGGWDKTLPQLIAAVKPEIILISTNGKLSGKSIKMREFYNNLSRNSRVYSTAENGWLAVKFGPAGIHAKRMY